MRSSRKKRESGTKCHLLMIEWTLWILGLTAFQHLGQSFSEFFAIISQTAVDFLSLPQDSLLGITFAENK